MNLFGIYEKAFPLQPLEISFREAAACGFDFVEVSIDSSDERLSRLEWEKERIRHIRDLAQQNGLTMMSLCLSGAKRYPLGVDDAHIANMGLEMTKKATAFCHEAGIRIMQISGFDNYYSQITTSDSLNRYIANLSAAVKYAEYYGVMYAIEPVEYHIDTERKIVEIINEIDSPWLTIYPDIANMAGMGHDVLEELSFGIDKTVALHVREALPNRFDNIEFGTGIVEFKKVFAILNEHNYTGPITLEIWNESNTGYLEKIRHDLAFIKQFKL